MKASDVIKMLAAVIEEEGTDPEVYYMDEGHMFIIEGIAHDETDGSIRLL